MIAELMAGSIEKFISSIGYFGIFILMSMESAALPIPSEVVMPFAGYMAYKGIFNVVIVSIVGALGCMTGSIISYYIGYSGGRPLIEKYGKYLFIESDRIELAERWFKKYGDKAVLLSRLLPIVRTFISLPAGIGKYDIKKLVIFSFMGSLPWCFALAYTGFYLGPYWERIIRLFNGLAILIVGIVIVIILYYWKIRKYVRKYVIAARQHVPRNV